MGEMRIAEQHAAQAAEAQDLQQVKAHLQQALNCLVGRGSGEYRITIGDPYKVAWRGMMIAASNANANQPKREKPR
jgi:hypothetical protein